MGGGNVSTLTREGGRKEGVFREEIPVVATSAVCTGTFPRFAPCRWSHQSTSWDINQARQCALCDTNPRRSPAAHGHSLGAAGLGACRRRRLPATGPRSQDPPHVAASPAGIGAAATGGAGPGQFVSRAASPGAPAAVAPVPSAGVGMELPAVNLKVAMGGRARGGAGLPECVGRLVFLKVDLRGERIETLGREEVGGRRRLAPRCGGGELTTPAGRGGEEKAPQGGRGRPRGVASACAPKIAPEEGEGTAAGHGPEGPEVRTRPAHRGRGAAPFTWTPSSALAASSVW